MPKRNDNHPSIVRHEIVTAEGFVTTPPDSPKIMIHVRRRKCVGIYCDHPAKVLVVETRGDPLRIVDPSYQATLAAISPQTSTKVVSGYRTSVDHVLAMPFDDPSMDRDLCRVLEAHEVVLDGAWPDIW